MKLKSNVISLLLTPKSVRSILLITIISLNSRILFGQSDRSATNLPNGGLPTFDDRLRDFGGVRKAPSSDRKAWKQIRLKIEEWEKKSVPSNSIREKYQSFLKTDRSHIAIIFSDLNCELLKPGKMVSVEESRRCENAPQLQKNGSLYSFTLKKNYINYYDAKFDIRLNESNWWDLHFNNNRFVVGNCCAQAMIADLGEIDLENQNSNLPTLDYLNNFKAGKTVEEIQKNEQILQAGVKADGIFYQKTASVNVGHVYALRSISYDVGQKKSTTQKSLKILSNKTIFFKVAEMQEDGSLILLWKTPAKKK